MTEKETAAAASSSASPRTSSDGGHTHQHLPLHLPQQLLGPTPPMSIAFIKPTISNIVFYNSSFANPRSTRYKQNNNYYYIIMLCYVIDYLVRFKSDCMVWWEMRGIRKMRLSHFLGPGNELHGPGI